MKTLRTGLLLTLALAAMNLQSARADQPHMRSALAHLRSARAELDRAEHNKGGHRGRAVDYVNRAISEVEAGINYAKGR